MIGTSAGGNSAAIMSAGCTQRSGWPSAPVAPGAGPGPRELKGRVVYLICDWNLCLNGQAPFQFGLNVIGGEPVAQPAPR